MSIAEINTTKDPVIYHIEGAGTKLDCILHPDFKAYTKQLHLAFDYITAAYPCMSAGGTVVVGYSHAGFIDMDQDTQVVYIGFSTLRKPSALEYNTRAYNAVFGALVDAEAMSAADADALDERADRMAEEIWQQALPQGYQH